MKELLDTKSNSILFNFDLTRKEVQLGIPFNLNGLTHQRLVTCLLSNLRSPWHIGLATLYFMADAPSVTDFPNTRWSLVLHAQADADNLAGRSALEELCGLYWYPLYAFARRCGHPPDDAEDLTQGFFTRILEQKLFAKADQSRGRLRSFLLGAFKNFMSEERRRASREKRGGGLLPIPIHELPPEALGEHSNYWQRSAEPECMFDRIWFDVLLEHALSDLEREYQKRGKGDVFKRLHEFLAWNRKDGQLADAAADLGMSQGAIRVAVLRMRQRFRELIERQILETVGTAAEAAEELEHLRRTLGA